MATPADTSTLSDAEILHLLRTLAPGIPPGLNHPPLPPDTLTPPPWAARPQTARLGRWIALAGALGLLILWGIAHGGNGSAQPAGLASYPTSGPGVVYLAGVPATATPLRVPSPVPPRAAPPPTAAPTRPATIPPVVPTGAPPTLAPPSATAVRVVASPVPRPRPRPTAPPIPPSPTTPLLPPAPPTVPPVTPPAAGGSGAWGNDWLDPAIQAREATALAAPTPGAP